MPPQSHEFHETNGKSAEQDGPVLDRHGRPLRDLRISVTDRCNFRCPYCMPAEVYGEGYAFMPRRELLTFEEIVRLARLAVDLGVSKIRITGGEPLMRRDLERLITDLRAIPGVEDLALTTNGVFLADRAAVLRKAGLDRVTVSLDSLDEKAFNRLSGRDTGPGPVLEGIAAAEAAGLGPIKINCVVVGGVNDDGILPLAERFRGSGHILRFIEYMDVGTLNDWQADRVVTAKKIIDEIERVHPLEPVEPGYRGEVARRYRYADGAGEIGIIASVTSPFCGDCTRARLSSDGSLVTCLFASGGRDLKTPLRDGASDDELRARMAGTWKDRTDRYSERRAEVRSSGERKKIEMYQIGG
jgi:cyclic pyranopterin phosphate synthase